jgi:hypothetical protein
MRRRTHLAGALIAAGALLGVLLAGCGFHSGGDTIAYLRGGQLWSVNPDGTGATALAGGGVVGFAWSPDHHQLVFRTTTGTLPAFSQQAAPPDAPGALNVTSADGGGTVTITPVSAGLARGDAWWDASGNRLVYREGLPGGSVPIYVLSQSDQPVGIARLFLQGAGGLPAPAPDGTQAAWVDVTGGLHLGKPGASGQVIATGALLTVPEGRPARLLWQPGHHALLYDAQNGGGQIKLVLTDLSGHGQTVGTAAGLLDNAFSPDGSLLLVHTGAAFAVWRVGAAPAAVVYSWSESDPDALAWWSPDGRAILVRDQAGLELADLGARATRPLLATPAPVAAPGTPAPAAAWQPLVSSPWSADSTRIVFTDPGSGLWQGRALPSASSGGGLYVAASSGSAAPQLLVSGVVAWPGWSVLDPSASLLVAS